MDWEEGECEEEGTWLNDVNDQAIPTVAELEMEVFESDCKDKATSILETEVETTQSGKRLWASLLGLSLVVAAVAMFAIHWPSSYIVEGMPRPEEPKTKWKENKETERPPLSHLVDDDLTSIIGDVQFLLDFAIIGHSKTATSAHLHWLRTHPQVQMYDHEVRLLKKGKAAEMVSLMYALPEGIRGYKAPNDVRSKKALTALRTYWPETKLIVGLRHPITWFESYYNFKYYKEKKELPPAETMVGRNMPDQVFFHQHLSSFGKTNVLNPSEAELLGNMYEAQPPRMQNPVFLYEVSQPFDKTDDRDIQYRQDLSDYVGLSEVLGPPPLRTHPSPHYHIAIDICDHKFRKVRKELIEIGKTASEWIRNYFMGLPDVTVSSPDHFRTLLDEWEKDPCEKEPG